jgi:hypothetical protein
MARIQFPLDPEAVKAADDEFYRRHPEMAPNGFRRPLHPTSAEHAAMRREWVELYLSLQEKREDDEEDDDDVDPIDPKEPCPKEKPCLDCVEIGSVNLFSVYFVDEHGKLKDNTSDWKNTGSLYKSPDWSAAGKAHPMSFTMDKSTGIDIEYSVDPENACPESGTVSGEIEGQQAIGPESAGFAPSKKPVSLSTTSNFKFADLLIDSTLSIDWSAEEKSTHDMGTSENRIFLIFGPSKEGGYEEDGVTLKRMEAAVKWASEAGSIDEFEIVNHLFNQFDRYVLGIEHLSEDEQEQLRSDPLLLAELTGYEWPRYFNDEVGAWPLAEFKSWGGECQAICRFIRGVMRQIGSRDKLEFVTYTADFSDPETPLNRGEPTGPKKNREYALADSEVERFKTYWEPLPGETAEVGWNNFEAYLEYMSAKGGPVRLFGGGVGLLEKKRNPLDVFYAIVEYEWKWRKKELPNGTKVDQAGRYVTRLHVYDNTKPWP